MGDYGDTPLMSGQPSPLQDLAPVTLFLSPPWLPDHTCWSAPERLSLLFLPCQAPLTLWRSSTLGQAELLSPLGLCVGHVEIIIVPLVLG